jgi:uncharacterized protein with NRDE domain
MCVLAFAWRAHPAWQLVVAGNRDELHARPAAPLARWEEPGHVLAGRDLESGGTWIGVSEQGRFAVVTNLRGHGAPEPGRVSRGALIAGFLVGDDPNADPSAIPLEDYNPFNLITADRARAHFVSNRPREIRAELAPGVYGLSNGALDEPWPKTLQLKASMLEWLVAGKARPEALLDALREERLADVGIDPAVPSDVPQEPRCSPIFIRSPVYGTRCSTVVAIDAGGDGVIVERRYAPGGEPTGDTTLTFRWPRTTHLASPLA